MAASLLNFVGEKVKDAADKGVIKSVARWFILGGVGFIIVGFAIAFGAFHMESAGQKAIASGAYEIGTFMSTFSNATASPSQPWGGWNIQQDLVSIGDSVSTYGGDLVNAVSDLPKAVTSLPLLAQGAATVLTGKAIYGMGWVGEQLFPWLIGFGIVLLAAGGLLIALNFYATNLYAYMKPRLVIRNKAFKRRWLQRPLDHVVIPKRVIERANEWNSVESAVNAIAYNEAADLAATKFLVSSLKAKRALDEMEDDVDESPTDSERALALRLLAKGKNIGSSGWVDVIKDKVATLVMAIPSGDVVQESLFKRLAKSNVGAMTHVVDDKGEVGVISVGLTEAQSLRLAAYPNQTSWVLVGWKKELAKEGTVAEDKGKVLEEYDSVEFGTQPLLSRPWFYLPNVGLYFRVFTKPKEKAEPLAPHPVVVDAINKEAAKAQRVAEAAPMPQDVANPETPELTLEEYLKMPPDDQEKFIRERPMYVSQEVYAYRAGETPAL